ncbi:MAG: hypothetical protein PHF25_07415 [Candidatus Margulisbacteria bacterium]|nr:hypothetical protein [Candidatus Margulisiibacteriota bacterium]
MIEAKILSQISILEGLQSKELRVYQTFLDSLQRHIKGLLPNVDKMDILNEMMASKKTMMDEITAIEEELSPIRKEISAMANVGEEIDASRAELIKNKDIQIIETISQISLAEQELTKRIQERMSEISSRLREIGSTKKLKNQYGGVIHNPAESKKIIGKSYLDFSG